MRIPLLSALAILLAGASVTQAQRGTARLEGTVTDSLHGKPLVGATVLVTRNTEPAAWFNATTDERGRYRLDTLLAGRYSAALWHPILDSLELTLPSRAIEIQDGQHATLDLALPSGATLRAGACAGVDLPPGTGALGGRVTDADSDRPLGGAMVAVRWSDLTVDRATLQVSSGERTAGAPVNGDGLYRICGLPTDSWLAVQVQQEGKAGSELRLFIPDSVGIAVLNLAYSAEAGRALVDADTVPANQPLAERLLTGTASVSGTVFGETGQPLANTQLHLLETAGRVRTDSTGRFTLAALPAGTQLLEAKHIGYRIVQQPVQLLKGREIRADIHLQRVVSLDSVRIVAQRSRYREFERNKRGGFGRFMTDEDIEKKHALQVTDLLRMTPGMRIEGSGFDAKVVSNRGTISLSRASCEVNVVIDNMQHQDINWLQPSDIGAMEIYSGPAGAPVQYDRACGLIVIWTKR
ncbi:MAG TPA: carboxypeptidase regulatory-like domain-containing protein [Gemmatimonadaceae bacterium]|nr:carboxypeptidase regulatory-like domain-containing protein [Gemmatimonadaceae bacterium]